MPTIKSLLDAPTLAEFIEKIRQQENTTGCFDILAYDLEFYPDGTLQVASKNLQGKFPVSDEADNDLAHIAEIPDHYFKDCDPELRSLSFNRRLRQKIPAEMPLKLVLQKDIILKVSNAKLLSAPRLPILDTVSNATPSNIQKEDLKVIEYEWNGQFDVSIISPISNCQPRENDTVAFGINISEDRNGAIQVQGAAFRCICSNGAINRICDGRHHRIRRPINRIDHQRVFLGKISSFAHDAWAQWPQHADGLSRLANIPIDLQRPASLMSRLRQAPFFLSAGVVNRILHRLHTEIDVHQNGTTLYDLWNAMTFIGSHEHGLSQTYRMRLRLGAGEFTRHESKICGECRQLLLT